MSVRETLGLYGPNTTTWGSNTYHHIERAGVRWVVWRTDADQSAPRQLERMGLHVLAQAPDAFGSNPWLAPAARAQELLTLIRARCPVGTPVVVDNEPQVHPRAASLWHAEQYTRYLRALHATWRWLDPASHYPLISPALACGPDRNGVLWHGIAREPETEADGVALHAYWQTRDTIDDSDFGAPWELLPPPSRNRPLYVLEYGQTAPEGSHQDYLAQYETWLRALPATVQCACLFILDGTPDWQRFAIAEPVLDWLAHLED